MRTAFREIGGNGVFMYGYNRWNTVAQSEFVWLGDSAVALVGVAMIASPVCLVSTGISIG